MISLRQLASLGLPKVLLTNSAHQILKWLRNYCSLLKPLSSKAEDIFNGMCDLFDGYFLDVFLFVGGISLHQLVWEEDLITTRLQSTLLRILKTEGNRYRDEIERIEALKPPTKQISNAQHKFTFEIKSFANRFNTKPSFPTTNASNGTPSGNSLPKHPKRDAAGLFGMGNVSPRSTSTLSDHQASLLKGNNMYGLKETMVAIGSVQLLAKELTHVKSKIQSLLPTTATRSLENYFSRTVDATEDLHVCAFRNAARRMLQPVFDSEKGIVVQISATPYDPEEPSDTQNPWAHAMGEYISQFSEVIQQTKLPENMVAQVSSPHNILNGKGWFQMWEHALKACSEAILDGLSMVRRCTMQGRSMMSLDLSYVETHFKLMAPNEVLVNLRLVDGYIKVLYLRKMFWNTAFVF